MLENKVNPIKHAYYTEYLSLQKLCLMILNKEKSILDSSGSKVNGVIFDVAWLWEEYLNKLLKHKNIIHSLNKENKKGVSIFVGKKIRNYYPDFYHRSDDCSFVLDAKYKRLGEKGTTLGRNDLLQMVTYSYIQKTNSTGVIYPSVNRDKVELVGKLAGYGAYIFKYGLSIPQKYNSYNEFASKIEKSETVFCKFVDELLITKESDITKLNAWGILL